MKRVMIDVEALGPAAIIQIGAVFWQMGGDLEIQRDFKATIDFRDALKYGQAQGDTIAWWFRQTSAARESVLESPIPAKTAGKRLQQWIKEIGPTEVWAHNYDHSQFEMWWKALGLKRPWHYRQERDLRTVDALVPDAQLEIDDGVGVPHDALYDARKQMRRLQRKLEILGKEMG